MSEKTKIAFFKWWERWYAYPVLLFVMNFLATALAEIALSLSRRGKVEAIDVFGAGLLGGTFGGGSGLLGVGLFALWQRTAGKTGDAVSAFADNSPEENTRAN